MIIAIIPAKGYSKRLQNKNMRLLLGKPMLQYAIDYAKQSKRDTYELKKRFYKMLISINILEGIRFYVSFACTFGFGELRLMEGSAKIISLIARDESQHLAITQHIIKNYQKNEQDKEMLKVIVK